MHKGRGIFTVGDKEYDIDGDKDPTQLIIPGNVPHQMYNPFDKPLKYFFYFPDGEKLDQDIVYYFPNGTVKAPGGFNK